MRLVIACKLEDSAEDDVRDNSTTESTALFLEDRRRRFVGTTSSVMDSLSDSNGTESDNVVAVEAIVGLLLRGEKSVGDARTT
jgi:hypothetical protein